MRCVLHSSAETPGNATQPLTCPATPAELWEQTKREAQEESARVLTAVPRVATQAVLLGCSSRAMVNVLCAAARSHHRHGAASSLPREQRPFF